jgi:hypothetical protein
MMRRTPASLRISSNPPETIQAIIGHWRDKLSSHFCFSINTAREMPYLTQDWARLQGQNILSVSFFRKSHSDEPGDTDLKMFIPLDDDILDQLNGDDLLVPYQAGLSLLSQYGPAQSKENLNPDEVLKHHLLVHQALPPGPN